MLQLASPPSFAVAGITYYVITCLILQNACEVSRVVCYSHVSVQYVLVWAALAHDNVS
jgi:hypothetical protein